MNERKKMMPSVYYGNQKQHVNKAEHEDIEDIDGVPCQAELSFFLPSQ